MGQKGAKPKDMPEFSLLEGHLEFSEKAKDVCPENQSSLLSRISPGEIHVRVRMFRTTD